jgi:2-methylcitrate dehydratase PrpD
MNANGKDVITAFNLGIDLETRLDRAISPMGMYNRSFHPSAVCGCFGAAMTAGKLLGLTEKEFSNAFGLCGCQASGLLAWESDKTEMSRPLNIGVAARNGVFSALLSKEGFGGPEVLEGKYTVFNAFSGEAHYDELLKDLGEQFAVMNQSIKKYASCAYIQGGLDALLTILKENDLNPEHITKLVMKVPSEEIMKLIQTSTLKSHDARYITAVGAFNKEVLVDDILEDRYADPKIFQFSQLIELQYDRKLADLFPDAFPTSVQVTTEKNAVFTERVDYPKGDPRNPMTQEEVEAKFMRLALTVIKEDRVHEIIKMIDKLEVLKDITELTKLLRVQQYSSSEEGELHVL